MIQDLQRRRFSFWTRYQAWSLKSFCVAEFYWSIKRDRESFWHRHQKGAESDPLASVSKGVIYFLKTSAYNVGDLGSIPGLGGSPGEGNGNPLQYSCLENPMDGEAWQATVHGVAKSQTERLHSLTHTQWIKRMQGCKDLTRPTPTIYILRWQD